MFEINGLSEVFKEITREGGLFSRFFGKGIIQGMVVDPSEKPLQNVQIKLRDDRGQTFEEETAFNGKFIFTGIRGKADISIAFDGMTIERFDVLIVGGGEKLDLAYKLDTSKMGTSDELTEQGNNSKVLEPYSPEDSNNHLRANFQQVLNLYSEAKKSTFAGDNDVKSALQKIKQIFESMELFSNNSQLKLKWSVGQGKWAHVPWLSIRDERVLSSGNEQKLFCTYLFREDLSGFYLTCMQKTAKISLETLETRAEKIRPSFDSMSNLGFDSHPGTIYLGENNMAKSYQSGTIIHKLYQTGAIPEDATLEQDLKSLIFEYQKFIDENIAQSK